MDFKNLDAYIKDYLNDMKEIKEAKHTTEGNTRRCMSSLLGSLAKDNDLFFVEEDRDRVKGKRNIFYDGVIKKDGFAIAYWEAKDEDDDLEKAIEEKFNAGYKDQNILFENTKRGILYQNGKKEKEIDDIQDRSKLRSIIEAFFSYEAKAVDNFLKGIEDFKAKIPDISKDIFNNLEERKKENKEFKSLLEKFQEECKKTLNPSVSIEDIENMLVQHIITKKCFNSIMGEYGFLEENPLAKYIETILEKFYDRQTINSLTARLNRYYDDISNLAKVLPSSEFSSRQTLLNRVYEVFFQAFAKDDADRLGIVYTPEEIVDFILESADYILKEDFGKSISEEGVHILDPCVGTGNFIAHLLEKIVDKSDRSNLERKYSSEIHCNEISLLPYYVSSLNIEKTYEKITGKPVPFKTSCLVDTLELAENEQFDLIVESENTKRVTEQQSKDIFLIIGNPPYNVGQKSENEDNKNKAHKTLDKKINESYVKHSKATSKTSLYDTYVKFFRFATDRLEKKEGIVAFITNNSFVNGYSFYGFRKCIAKDFSKIIHLDLGGNARRDRDGGNIFGIMVGVGISFFIKKKDSKGTEIKYYKVGGEKAGGEREFFLKKEEKLTFLSDKVSIANIEFRSIVPDGKGNWFPELLGEGFDDFISIGNKDKKVKEKLFDLHSRGVCTNRDKIVYDFNEAELGDKVKKLIELYDYDLYRYNSLGKEEKNTNLDSFVTLDNPGLKWDRDLKKYLKRGKQFSYDENKIYSSMYRPFVEKFLYFERGLNARVYQLPKVFPTKHSKNRAICLSGLSHSKPFSALMVNILPCLDIIDKTQCFPLYAYEENGSGKKDNITDFALSRFRSFYESDALTKEDVFYYVYAVLHLDEYREKYKENLKKELPRFPFISKHKDIVDKAEIFSTLSNLGRELGNLHINYKEAKEYDLVVEEEYSASYNIKKMKWDKDKTILHYNSNIVISDFPPKCFDYKLGIRSPVEWVADQYKDWNENNTYVMRLIKKLVTVSIDSLKIIDKVNDYVL